MTGSFHATITLMLGVWLAAVPQGRAQVAVNLGNYGLQPNLAGQQVALYVQNDGVALDYGGLNFSVRVADGGPAGGGTVLGPTITAVDLLTDTPFAGKSIGGQFPDAAGNKPQKQFWSVISLTATLPNGPSRLATLTFDTTGLSAGTWDLSLYGLGMPTTQLTDYSGTEHSVTIANGTLTVVPEPGPTAIAAGLGLVAFAVGRHRSGKQPRLNPISKPEAGGKP